MVSSSPVMLDRTFAALADPTRRAIVARLADGRAFPVGELASQFPMSLPAVIKHLDVLTEAGLVTRTRAGRYVQCALAPAPMSEAVRWLEAHLLFWNQRLDALGDLIESNQDD